MVFIGEKAYRTIDLGTPVYKPSNTRPLSLANTSSKLVAATLRIAVMPHIALRVHPAQKAMPGRWLVDHVLTS